MQKNKDQNKYLKLIYILTNIYCSPLAYLCREGVRREGEEMREELASTGEEERGRKKLGEKEKKEEEGAVRGGGDEK